MEVTTIYAINLDHAGDRRVTIEPDARDPRLTIRVCSGAEIEFKGRGQIEALRVAIIDLYRKLLPLGNEAPTQ
jgi:hypothetical protein